MFFDDTSNMPLTTEITAKGNFGIGGCDTVELAKEFGTPLYVMDEETLRNSCRQYMDAFSKALPGAEVVFASKSMSVLGVLKVLKEEGLCIDVVSGGELYTALKAGFSPEKIFFHGNNKSAKELSEALAAGVKTIVADNFQEIALLDELAKEQDKKQEILIRVTPGVEAHTHEFIRTGQLDSKFGIHADKMVETLEELKKYKHVVFKGLHVHIGSQILEVNPFSYTIEIMMDLIKNIKEKNKLTVEILNLGGGLGISYLPKDTPPAVEEYAKTIAETLKFKAESLKIKQPRIMVEPGRSIVGPAGITLYTVGYTKDLKGIRKYIFIDGGMADNPRPITYQAKYDALIANKIEKKKTELVTVAGKFCESGDILIKDICLQPPQTGDILAVLGTGAYNFSMASNYNQALKPAMVMVNNGTSALLVKRESYEDLLRNHVL